MKKVVIPLLIGAMLIMAAAPAPHNYFRNTGETTVTKSGIWVNGSSGGQVLDSIVPVASDSANVLITISGIAVLSANDRLYIGLGHDSANRVSATDLGTMNDLDTFLVQAPSYIRNQGRFPFSFQYGKANNGALTDTLYVNAWLNQAGGYIAIEDMVVTAQVNDQ